MFWAEDFLSLFRSPYLIPTPKMPLDEQMNCITRVILIVFLALLIVNVWFDVLFLCVALLLTIIVYYSLRGASREEYGRVDSVLVPPPPVPQETGAGGFVFSPPTGLPRSSCGSSVPPSGLPVYIDADIENPSLIDTETSSAYAFRDVPIEKTYGDNQRFAGPPNPRTLVRPIIPCPIYSDEWVSNDFIIPAPINDQRRQELWQNGYVTRDDERAIASIQENYDSPNAGEYAGYGVRSDYYNQGGGYASNGMDRACGYDPSNLRYGLPVNYRASACDRTPEMRAYNENLFSIPIQPGLYTRSQVNQADASMANLGISYTQPFLPTTLERTAGGVDEFVEHDPATVRPCPLPPYNSEDYGAPLVNEVYDPRLTGYGTGYRSYVEPVTGQPRFYYDDIDQARQPNFISRNKLDIYGFAPRVGAAGERVLNGGELREAANQTFVDSQLQFRTELQQRLLHKNSNREWQQRVAPITTNQRASSGRGTVSGYFK